MASPLSVQSMGGWPSPMSSSFLSSHWHCIACSGNGGSHSARHSANLLGVVRVQSPNSKMSPKRSVQYWNAKNYHETVPMIKQSNLVREIGMNIVINNKIRMLLFRPSKIFRTTRLLRVTSNWTDFLSIETKILLIDPWGRLDGLLRQSLTVPFDGRLNKLVFLPRRPRKTCPEALDVQKPEMRQGKWRRDWQDS